MNSGQSSKYTPHEASLTSTWLQRSFTSKFTLEEKALIPIVRDKWLRIGLATGATDREAAQAAISDVYLKAGFEPPRLWIWLGNPKAGFIADCYADRHSADKQHWSQQLDDLLERGGREVRDQIEDQVGGQVGDQIGTSIYDQTMCRAHKRLWGQVPRRIHHEVSSQLLHEIQTQIEPVADQIDGHIVPQFSWRNRIRSPVEIWPDEGFSHTSFSSYDKIGLLAVFDFIHRIGRGNVNGLEFFHPLMRAAAVAGWWWPFERACIVTERPTRLLRDAAHRLHCSDGPALLYPDGWAIYAWHAVPIHDWFVEDKRRITPDVIEAESNAELRRVMLEIFGFDRYIEVRGARLIAEDECLGLPRQLFELDLRGVSVRVLRAVNGTVEADGRQRQFHLSVPLECNTPHEAVAWSYGRPAHLHKEAMRT